MQLRLVDPRLVRGLILGVAVGCSGGHTHPAQPAAPQDAERSAADQRRDALEAERPASPYETRRTIAFTPAERCGQGPYRLEADAVGAAYSEQTIVYACGAHDISGNYRFTVTRPKSAPSTSEAAFGFGRRDNAACKADRPVPVVSGGASGGGASHGGGGGGASGGTKAVRAAATVAPTKLARSAVVPTACSSRTQVMHHTWDGHDDKPPFAAGTRLAIDIWSDELNDLEGLTFVIETRGVRADMTPARWATYGAAMDAWYARKRALLDEEVAAGRTKLLDSTVKMPPPPPPRAERPPPRPSRNARWIPGYWHYAAPEFHWIAGLWDVPQADVEQDLTVHAPRPPPPPPVEQPRAAPPVATATWTPGQWQWDGRAYVWVAGAWRIPPRPDQTWKPSGWRAKVGGAIYVPGGWVLRVRTR